MIRNSPFRAYTTALEWDVLVFFAYICLSHQNNTKTLQNLFFTFCLKLLAALLFPTLVAQQTTLYEPYIKVSYLFMYTLTSIISSYSVLQVRSGLFPPQSHLLSQYNSLKIKLVMRKNWLPLNNWKCFHLFQLAQDVIFSFSFPLVDEILIRKKSCIFVINEKLPQYDLISFSSTHTLLKRYAFFSLKVFPSSPLTQLTNFRCS